MDVLHPKVNTCSPPAADEMFENYMDYTSDTCMNISQLTKLIDLMPF